MGGREEEVDTSPKKRPSDTWIQFSGIDQTLEEAIQKKQNLLEVKDRRSFFFRNSYFGWDSGLELDRLYRFLQGKQPVDPISSEVLIDGSL
jgi:hypothetical protein